MLRTRLPGPEKLLMRSKAGSKVDLLSHMFVNRLYLGCGTEGLLLTKKVVYSAREVDAVQICRSGHYWRTEGRSSQVSLTAAVLCKCPP